MKMNYQAPTIEVFKLLAGADVLTDSPSYENPEDDEDDTVVDDF